MQVGNITNTNDLYQKGSIVQSKAESSFEVSAAMEKLDCETEGEFLGITMIPEEGQSMVYGMRAMLPKESTASNPIVQVVSNLEGKYEVYNIEINKIDPENATRMEMFALCSYEDKFGEGTGSTFGSFHTFRVYEELASQNGCTKQIKEYDSSWEQFQNEKVNWVELCNQVCNSLKNSKDTEILDLFVKGKRLQEMYSKYSKDTEDIIK